ncbi:MAG: transcription elongation factor GreA [Bacillus subtilis]|nr:transcription elongation factor GreA [Bacillus subtilis]
MVEEPLGRALGQGPRPVLREDPDHPDPHPGHLASRRSRTTGTRRTTASINKQVDSRSCSRTDAWRPSSTTSEQGRPPSGSTPCSDDVKDLDPVDQAAHCASRSPNTTPTSSSADEEEKAVVSRGLMVTAEKYEEKQKLLLAQIMEVDVPANQKEIAYALSLGDLRENAEYKAAKEKQDELNSKVAKLKNEIERAQIFDKSTINASKVSFGTVVHLANETEGKDETYTILGPWESEPTSNVISYLSPLGKKLLNHKAGDRLSFSIHDRKFEYVTEVYQGRAALSILPGTGRWTR